MPVRASSLPRKSIELIVEELKKMAAGEIKEEELNRTRGQLVGSMMLGLESTDSWMSHIARNEIYFGKPVPRKRSAGESVRFRATT